MKSLFLYPVVHAPRVRVIDEVAADIRIYTHGNIPSFKEIAVLCNDGIQSGDFEVDFGTIVQKNGLLCNDGHELIFRRS